MGRCLFVSDPRGLKPTIFEFAYAALKRRSSTVLLTFADSLIFHGAARMPRALHNHDDPCTSRRYPHFLVFHRRGKHTTQPFQKLLAAEGVSDAGADAGHEVGVEASGHVIGVAVDVVDVRLRAHKHIVPKIIAETT